MDWQLMETAPEEGTPILAAVLVTNNKTGAEHWDRHIIWWDDEGKIADDAYQGWDWDDYTHWMPLPAPPSSDPTPAAAEARATKATERDAKDFAVEFGGYLADAATDFLDRYVAVPRTSNAEDFQHLRSAIYEFRKRADRIPEAKDGAAPSPEQSNFDDDTQRDFLNREAFVPEAGWRLVPVEATPEMADAARTFLEPCTVRIGQAAWRAMLAAAPAAPAAPSPDLAAWRVIDRLEVSRLRLARRNLERPDETLEEAAGAIRTAIRHLKAQPNAGPSADGGKAGKT